LQYIIRRADIEDIPDLVRLRRIMFEDMGLGTKESNDLSDENTRKQLEGMIPNADLIGWVVIQEGRIIVSGAILFDQHLPSPLNPTGWIAYILNVAVEEPYQQKGIATHIMVIILN